MPLCNDRAQDRMTRSVQSQIQLPAPLPAVGALENQPHIAEQAGMLSGMRDSATTK